MGGMLRTGLEEHGHDPDRHALRALVPVSVRSDEQKGELGNQITVLVPLSIGESTDSSIQTSKSPTDLPDSTILYSR